MTIRYVPTAKRPMRYENIRPGSYFQIVAEPSRGIRRSNDERVYWRSTGGFFSVHVDTGDGCVLHPQDIVMPLRQVGSH